MRQEIGFIHAYRVGVRDYEKSAPMASRADFQRMQSGYSGTLTLASYLRCGFMSSHAPRFGTAAPIWCVKGSGYPCQLERSRIQHLPTLQDCMRQTGMIVSGADGCTTSGKIYGISHEAYDMGVGPFYRKEVECLPREDLDALIDERVQYTIAYAATHSPFYRAWFREHGIDPGSVRSHEDLRLLPIVSGRTIREHQPPVTKEFMFRSVSWSEVFTIHETSGTSGTPKSFFLTWDDWARYAEKYARSFVSQGFSEGDRIIICASYGMNVGANTMTLAARNIRMTIIPIGKCTFPSRIITSYHPTGIVGSVFKLLRLAKRLEEDGISPRDVSVRRLIVGGESFSDEAREYVAEVWDREVFNTYGSTEGSMCGECTVRQGLHVPEDLVHLDVYDPALNDFVPEGDCGRAVLTTLLPPGGRAGTLLINYDTEDTTVVMSREPCACGRTHMKIMNPQREAETVWILGTPVNKVDIERGVFQRPNMEYLTGEYEAFVYGSDDPGEAVLRVSMESQDISAGEQELVAENFRRSFYRYKPVLRDGEGDTFSLLFHFTPPGGLELARLKGRPRRLVDRRD